MDTIDEVKPGRIVCFTRRYPARTERFFARVSWTEPCPGGGLYLGYIPVNTPRGAGHGEPAHSCGAFGCLMLWPAGHPNAGHTEARAL